MGLYATSLHLFTNRCRAKQNKNVDKHPHPTFFSYLQIVTFQVVKKSEATSRECQQNESTCCWFVKMQGFYDFVFC